MHSDQKQVEYIKQKTGGIINLNDYNGVSPCFKAPKWDHCTSKGPQRNNNILLEFLLLSTAYWVGWIGFEATTSIHN